MRASKVFERLGFFPRLGGKGSRRFDQSLNAGGLGEGAAFVGDHAIVKYDRVIYPIGWQVGGSSWHYHKNTRILNSFKMLAPTASLLTEILLTELTAIPSLRSLQLAPFIHLKRPPGIVGELLKRFSLHISLGASISCSACDTGA